MGMSGGKRIAKQHMLCMFCDSKPCKCNNKPAPPKPVKVDVAVAPALATKAAPVHTEDPDWAAIRLFHAAGMLHPEEIKRWQNTALLGLVTEPSQVLPTVHPPDQTSQSLSHTAPVLEQLITLPTASTTTRLIQWKERRRSAWTQNEP